MSKMPRSKEKFKEIHDRLADAHAALETVCYALEAADSHTPRDGLEGPDVWYILRTARRATDELQIAHDDLSSWNGDYDPAAKRRAKPGREAGAPALRVVESTPAHEPKGAA
jgi:hypothetical protein